ncbi:uncharacterized protein ACA1_197310, partial [Acanthamoeba castellanii str. Neff]
FPARKTSNIGKAGEEEAKCEHGGYTTHDRRRVLLDKNTPLREVRRHLDRKLRQPRMTDDYGHAFQESDLEQPLWKFSDGCALQVVFVPTDMDNLKDFAEQGTQKVMTSLLRKKVA